MIFSRPSDTRRIAALAATLLVLAGTHAAAQLPAPTDLRVNSFAATTRSASQSALIGALVTDRMVAVVFSASSNCAQTVTKYQIQIDDDALFASPLWDSGAAGTAFEAAHQVPPGTRCRDVLFAGGTAPTRNLSYCFRFRFFTAADQSAWSANGTFTMIDRVTQESGAAADRAGDPAGAAVRVEQSETLRLKIVVAASLPVTVTLWLRTSTYTGAQPTVTLTGLGIDGTGAAQDAMTVGNDTWEQLTVTGTPNARGALTVTITVSGDASSIVHLDDIVVSQ